MTIFQQALILKSFQTRVFDTSLLLREETEPD
ncbi:hypothetical protein RLEG12_32875 [Rhizobium leguminosarum bv. trifolii CB782]|nr:hypothetical protein RLEG12_32875 [Rhizobium leguminosarum bv. trifolii CB782]